jgi:S1-C subfamily serine protease
MLARPICVAALLTAVSACASEAPPPAASPATKSAASAPRPASAPPGHLSRSDVDNALAAGPPWILRRVAIEEVLKDGKFVGWRVVAMPAAWTGIDLKPGDVVTRVNGMTIERPEELYTAWTSLVVASDLKIAYERDGAPRELVFHIDGAPSKQSPVPAADAPPPPRKQPRGKSTIVITEETGSPDPDE